MTRRISSVARYTWQFVLVGLLAIISPAAAGPRPLGEWRSVITCVPHHYMMRFVDPEVRKYFPQLLQLSEADTRTLLGGNDPRDRGIGLFILDQRGDVGGLVRCVGMLEDSRQTIDESGVSAAPNHYVSAPQTVQGYYRDLCAVWLGVHVVDTAELAEVIRAIDNPNMLAHPWMHRMQRARYDSEVARNPEELDRVREQVRALPPELRLVVILGAKERDVLTDEQAVEDIGTVPDVLLRAMKAGDDTPFLKVYAHDSARAFTRGIGDRYSKLLDRVGAAKNAPSKANEQTSPDRDADPKK